MCADKKVTVSAVVLVKNHRKHIRACLETLRWVDEVVVLNDNSGDGTIELAKQYPNVVVYDRALGINWTAQRNFGIEKATGDWIIQVDVDHRISRELADEIKAAIADTPHSAYAFKYTGVVLGRCFGDDEKARQEVHMVKRGMGLYGDRNQTHTRIEARGTTGVFKEPVIHLGPYPDSAAFFSKNIFYAETEALTNVKNNIKIPSSGGPGMLWWFVMKPAMAFFLRFVMHGYWKRGAAGFHYALLRAIGYYMVYLRTWELRYIDIEKHSEIQRICKARNIPLFLD